LQKYWKKTFFQIFDIKKLKKRKKRKTPAYTKCPKRLRQNKYKLNRLINIKYHKLNTSCFLLLYFVGVLEMVFE
jgi:hypothetical protein